MVMNVRLLGVVSLLILLSIIMAMRQLSVIVGMGVPGDAMLNLTATGDVMRNVPVIMLVGNGRVGMLGLTALALGVLLLSHRSASFPITRTAV